MYTYYICICIYIYIYTHTFLIKDVKRLVWYVDLSCSPPWKMAKDEPSKPHLAGTRNGVLPANLLSRSVAQLLGGIGRQGWQKRMNDDLVGYMSFKWVSQLRGFKPFAKWEENSNVCTSHIPWENIYVNPKDGFSQDRYTGKIHTDITRVLLLFNLDLDANFSRTYSNPRYS